MKNPNFEMCTPTGFRQKSITMNEGLSGTIQNIGYGAGSKDFDSSVNSITLFVGLQVKILIIIKS